MVNAAPREGKGRRVGKMELGTRSMRMGGRGGWVNEVGSERSECKPELDARFGW